MSNEQMNAGDVISLFRKRVTRREKYQWVWRLFYAVVMLGTVYFAWSSPDLDAFVVFCAFAGIVLADDGKDVQQHKLDKEVLLLLEQPDVLLKGNTSDLAGQSS